MRVRFAGGLAVLTMSGRTGTGHRGARKRRRRAARTARVHRRAGRVHRAEEKTAAFVAGMNEALDGRPFPPNASSIVGVTRLGVPGMLVEISAVAAVP